MAYSSEPTNKPVFLDFSKRRKWYFRGGTVVCLLFLLLCTSLFLFGLSFTTSSRQPITYNDAIQRYHYYYSAANNKKIALTFDDGPNPGASEKIMDSLEKDAAPATFFYIGNKSLIRPDLVAEASKRGFDVEDHSFTHSQNVQTSFNRVSFELNSTGYLLSEITGKPMQLYRPPYLLGIGIDPTINPYIPLPKDLLWILQNGYLPVGSDIDTKDWLATNPQQVVDGLARGLEGAPNGHIVLLHDDVNTSKAMHDVVTYLRGEGYTIVPLKELITPPSEVNLTRTLKPGDTDLTQGGDISRLQWFLYVQKYLDPYALSGVFDTPTRNALINFQTRNHLLDPGNPDAAALGVAGSATRDLIHSLSISEDEDFNHMAAEASSAGALGLLKNTVHVSILAIYIHLFPFLRSLLVGMVSITLLLVVARSMGLIFLLLLRWWRGRGIQYVPGPSSEPVSIIIPAYNEEENIAATVESVIASAYRPREIIVMNDGSKDRTAEEVESVIAAHPEERVRLISIENGGKAHALNVGIESAAYEIIVVLDADAVLDPKAVGYFMAHFSDPEVGAVAGKVCTTSSSGFLDIFQTLEYAIGQNIDKTALSTIGAVGVVPGPAGAWRRSFLKEAGGFHVDTLVEDQEMTLSLLHMGKKVVYEPAALAYTETPHTVKNFLKQRFRWVYGTMQCFWKHKSIMIERPDSIMSLVVMPNIFVYNILLPLTYPFADSALLFGLVFGEWRSLVLPFLVFTAIDLLYALWGLRGERGKWKLMLAVPLQRVVYRQLLYYSVYKGLIRAIEGTGTAWNKFTKIGETRRFYLSAMGGVQAALQLSPMQELLAEGPSMMPQHTVESSLSSANHQEAMSLSLTPPPYEN